MVSTLSTDQRDDYLAQLLEFSTKALQKKQIQRSPGSPHSAMHLSSHNWWTTFDRHLKQASPDLHPLEDLESLDHELTPHHDHAPPLMPIRERDMKELQVFFERQDMASIEADLLANLQVRVPEPCWEEVPLDFLKGYL